MAFAFSLQERDRRWSRVRELMAEQGVDVLVAFHQWMPGDALYLANRQGAVIFPLEGETTLIGGRAEPQPRPDSWIRDVRGATPSGTTAAPWGAAVAQRLKELRAGQKRVAIAGLRSGLYTLVRQPEGYANYSSVAEVRKALPRAKIVDGTPILTEARYVKSEEEIEAIRQSVQVAEASADALAEHAGPGIAAAEVYAFMIFEQARRGADPYVAWVGGPWGNPAPRSVGPPPGTLETGWFINNEIEPGVAGYTCQIDQPVCVGPVPSLAQEMFELGKAGFERACALMRPGATWGEVEDGVRLLARGSGLELEFLLHGRGLGNDGPMLIPTDGHDHARNDPLRANTVFILKPYAYPSGGSNYDDAHRFNVTWGDSVVVRPDGAQRLGTRAHALVSA